MPGKRFVALIREEASSHIPGRSSRARENIQDKALGASSERRHADLRQDSHWQDHHPRSGALRLRVGKGWLVGFWFLVFGFLFLVFGFWFLVQKTIWAQAGSLVFWYTHKKLKKKQ